MIYINAARLATLVSTARPFLVHLLSQCASLVFVTSSLQLSSRFMWPHRHFTWIKEQSNYIQEFTIKSTTFGHVGHFCSVWTRGTGPRVAEGWTRVWRGWRATLEFNASGESAGGDGVEAGGPGLDANPSRRASRGGFVRRGRSWLWPGSTRRSGTGSCSTPRHTGGSHSPASAHRRTRSCSPSRPLCPECTELLAHPSS